MQENITNAVHKPAAPVGNLPYNGRPGNPPNSYNVRRKAAANINGIPRKAHPFGTEFLQTFVRVKPFPVGLKLTKQQLMLYQVSNQAITINLEDVQQDMSKNVDVVGKKFFFSEAFGNDASQAQVFDRVVKPQVDNLFAGLNSTVMAYGSLTSGKTHTLEGSPADPGLIPLTLDLIFNRKKPLLQPNYKPTGKSLEILSPTSRSRERDFKRTLLAALPNADVNSYPDVLRKAQDLNVPASGLGFKNEIWISFLEIRDEQYYDPLSPEYQTRQIPLCSDVGPQGLFVKGLTHLHISSSSDGRNILAIGRNKLLKLEETLGRTASKSHCIFTINLLRYHEPNRPEFVKMSKMSFCDLAAHQEAPNFDTSLSTLVMAIQMHHEKRKRVMVADCFCLSSLSSLFEAALLGTEDLAVITHVDPNPGLYNQTHEALHFTAGAAEVVTRIRDDRMPELSTCLAKIMGAADGDSSWVDDVGPQHAGKLASNFQHAIAAYQVLDHKLKVTISTIALKKQSRMMEKLAHYHQTNSEMNKNLSPEEAEKLQASLDQVQSVFEQLQDAEEEMESELHEARDEWEDINEALPADYKQAPTKGLNPRVLLMEKEIEIQEELNRNENLVALLKEAKSELMTALQAHHESRMNKLGATERKYVALKLHRSMDQMLTNGVKQVSNKQLKLMKMWRNEIDFMARQRKMFQDRYEELCARFDECEGSPDYASYAVGSADVSDDLRSRQILQDPVEALGSPEEDQVSPMAMVSDVLMSLKRRTLQDPVEALGSPEEVQVSPVAIVGDVLRSPKRRKLQDPVESSESPEEVQVSPIAIDQVEEPFKVQETNSMKSSRAPETQVSPMCRTLFSARSPVRKARSNHRWSKTPIDFLSRPSEQMHSEIMEDLRLHLQEQSEVAQVEESEEEDEDTLVVECQEESAVEEPQGTEESKVDDVQEPQAESQVDDVEKPQEECRVDGAEELPEGQVDDDQKVQEECKVDDDQKLQEGQVDNEQKLQEDSQVDDDQKLQEESQVDYVQELQEEPKTSEVEERQVLEDNLSMEVDHVEELTTDITVANTAAILQTNTGTCLDEASIIPETNPVIPEATEVLEEEHCEMHEETDSRGDSEPEIELMDIALVEEVYSYTEVSPSPEESMVDLIDRIPAPQLDDYTGVALGSRKQNTRSRSSSTTGSAHLEPPILESNRVLNELKMKNGFPELEGLIENYEEQVNPKSNDDEIPNLEINMKAELEPRPRKSGRPPKGLSKKVTPKATPKVPKPRSSRKTRKNLVESIVISDSEDSTPLRRSGRKKRSCQTYSPSDANIPKYQTRIIESINCDNCDASVLHKLRYHCTICQKGDFDLCSKCYKKIGHEHTIESGELVLLKDTTHID